MNQSAVGVDFGVESASIFLFIAAMPVLYDGGLSPRFPGAICTDFGWYALSSVTPAAALSICSLDGRRGMLTGGRSWASTEREAERCECLPSAL